MPYFKTSCYWTMALIVLVVGLPMLFSAMPLFTLPMMFLALVLFLLGHQSLASQGGIELRLQRHIVMLCFMTVISGMVATLTTV